MIQSDFDKEAKYRVLIGIGILVCKNELKIVSMYKFYTFRSSLVQLYVKCYVLQMWLLPLVLLLVQVVMLR